MFQEMKRELKELIELVKATERFGATLAANRTIEPTDQAWAIHRQNELRKIDLLLKYELK